MLRTIDLHGDGELPPRRDVYVSTFYIDRFEVTTARYAQFLEANAAPALDQWDGVGLKIHAELPVTGVSWNDAQPTPSQESSSDGAHRSLGCGELVTPGAIA